MSELLSGLWIVGCLAFIFWRTNEDLKGPKIGKRPGLTMTVRDGHIYYRSFDK